MKLDFFPLTNTGYLWCGVVWNEVPYLVLVISMEMSKQGCFHKAAPLGHVLHVWHRMYNLEG